MERLCESGAQEHTGRGCLDGSESGPQIGTVMQQLIGSGQGAGLHAGQGGRAGGRGILLVCALTILNNFWRGTQWSYLTFCYLLPRYLPRYGQRHHVLCSGTKAAQLEKMECLKFILLVLVGSSHKVHCSSSRSFSI